MRRSVALVAIVLLAAGGAVAAQGKKKAPSAPKNSTLAIDGNPTTLVHCVQGSFYNAHHLGATVSGTRLIIDLEGNDNFDGTALAIVTQMGGEAPDGSRVSYQYGDDSGDTLDPHLDFELENDGNVTILVGSYNGDPGCYFLKIDARLPDDEN